VLFLLTKHNTHEAFREKLNFNFATVRPTVVRPLVGERKVKKFCVTRHRNSIPFVSVQLKKPHGSVFCATLLALSDIHRVIDRSWHCLVVVGLAFLACRRWHVVALLDCRGFTFRHAALHRFIWIGELLWTLTRILTRESRIMRGGWRSSVVCRHDVKLHARQGIANGHANCLLRHLKSIFN
jgi:hypothetical protein